MKTDTDAELFRNSSRQVRAFDGQIYDLLDDIIRPENRSAISVELQTIPYEALMAHYEGNPRLSLVNAAAVL